METTFKCFKCGLEKPLQNSGGTGYGQDKDDNKVCYECCAIEDKAHMLETGKATLYLGRRGQGYEITNWPGSLRFPVYHMREGRHNIARRQYVAYFYGPDGKLWSGRQYGDFTQIAHCKRLKA